MTPEEHKHALTLLRESLENIGSHPAGVAGVAAINFALKAIDRADYLERTYVHACWNCLNHPQHGGKDCRNVNIVGHCAEQQEALGKLR